MKRFRVRDGERGEFDVKAIRIEAKTKAFIAKAIALAALGVLIVHVVYAAIIGDQPRLEDLTSYATHVLTFLIGYYFKTSS